MPNKEFLEIYPLYKKIRFELMPENFEDFEKIAITMHCTICKADRTFLSYNQDISCQRYHKINIVQQKLEAESKQSPQQKEFQRIDGYKESDGLQQHFSLDKAREIASFLGNKFCFHSIYVCAHCQQFQRYFYIKVDKESKSISKVGQYPLWEIKGNRDTKYFSDKHSDYFKKALVCESQGYGIAAFSYYRRIVEEIIDSLLNEISELLDGEELEKYKTALEEVQKTIVTQNKIDLVKDLLPPTLRPEGYNPLALMHSTLSEGLHAESDDECLQCAMECREIIVFLVNQINDSKATTKKLTDNMKILLDKKARKEINKNKK